MKTVLFMIFTLLNFGIFAQNGKTVSTYYLIRHAEKVVEESTTMTGGSILNANNPDPELSDAGIARAQRWVEVFQNIRFDAVYSTKYIRTKSTALPTAKANNCVISIYDPKSFDYDKFKTETKGKKVLVVGHSNTIPGFANKLIGTGIYPDMADDNFGNLYIVQIIDGQATSQVLFIK